MKKILVTTLLLLATPSFASTINVQALEACSLIENDFKRLMCYDKVISREAITGSQKDATSKLSQSKSVKPKDTFGLENRKKEEAVKIDKLRAKVTKIKTNQIGYRTFTLDNGQVWRQTDTDSFSAKKGDEIIITRGVFNSFKMKKANNNRTVQVKRVR